MSSKFYKVAAQNLIHLFDMCDALKREYVQNAEGLPA